MPLRHADQFTPPQKQRRRLIDNDQHPDGIRENLPVKAPIHLDLWPFADRRGVPVPAGSRRGRNRPSMASMSSRMAAPTAPASQALRRATSSIHAVHCFGCANRN